MKKEKSPAQSASAASPLRGGKRPVRGCLQQTKEKVLAALKRVGLEGKEDKYPKQLSGGQQQRVAIARSIINNPKFIIADEPTGALDTHTSTEIMELFAELNAKDGATIILVTHDPEVVPYCHRLIKIRDGAIIADEAVKS